MFRPSMVVTWSVHFVQALKGFQLQVEVDPLHHPKIIGRKGAVISKIRADFEVNVQFPDRNEENQSIITITGYEQNAQKAREEIMSIVKDLVGSGGLSPVLEREEKTWWVVGLFHRY